MTALNGAGAVLLVAFTGASAVVGFAALVGPESFSGPWPWRLVGLVLWLAFGSVATYLCHVTGEGLAIVEERRKLTGAQA